MPEQLDSGSSLPDFARPPLAETVLSLQFEQLTNLTTAHVGLLWQRFRSELPLIEEHPPLASATEAFGPPTPSQVEVSIEEKPPAPRVWFLNPSKSELIQVQNDRFIHNWRNIETASPYPRYAPIRDRFRREVEKFEQFLHDEALGGLNVVQCEVTYINHVEISEAGGSHGQLGRILRVWSWPEDCSFLPEPEDAALRMRFIMKSDGGSPIGRLHASVQPAWKKVDGSPILTLTLTARGRPLGDDMDAAFAFFDKGREWIVRGFADLTTPVMHRAWERIDVG